MSRARRFVFTVNNYDSTRLSNIELPQGVRYLLFSEEIAPTTNTPHIQGYIELFQVWSWNPFVEMISKLFGNHPYVSPAKGTLQQQIDYISKQSSPIKLGTPAKDTQGTRNDLLEVQGKIDAGIPMADIAGEHFVSFCRYYKAFERYLQLIAKPRSGKSYTIFLTGPTNTGKTRMAFERFPDIKHIVYVNGFFSGCAPHVLFDDIDPRTFPRDKLLTLTDRYPTPINTKGGFMEWNPQVIVFTSNYSFEEVFPEEALQRRIDEVIVFPLQ